MNVCQGLLASLGALALLCTPALADTSFDLVRLIRNEQADARDPGGWAADLLGVLAEHKLPATRENVCAGIAVISQESGFVANPKVANLGRISEAALRAKLEAVPVIGARIIAYLEANPSPEDSVFDRIRAARTERDLDLTYRAIIEEIGTRTELGFILQSGLLNRWIEQRNEISTIGSMQVSVAFALAEERKRRWAPMTLQDTYRIRDELYTRRGGMHYGMLQLLGYDTGYDRKIYRFADFNAGRYASRNAAIQKVISELTDIPLARDGDLLAYTSKGKPATSAGQSEKAIRTLLLRKSASLTESDIRRDLKKEKSAGFVETTTYRLIREAYRRKTGRQAAFAMLPDIALKSEKISSRMTTKIFAERVNTRYQKCMKLK